MLVDCLCFQKSTSKYNLPCHGVAVTCRGKWDLAEAGDLSGEGEVVSVHSQAVQAVGRLQQYLHLIKAERSMDATRGAFAST